MSSFGFFILSQSQEIMRERASNPLYDQKSALLYKKVVTP